MTGLHIRALPFDHPDAAALISATLADLSARYGGTGDDTPVAAAEFVPPAGEFLIAYLDGVPAGCGGWRRHGADAELKRMFTAPAARRRGVARQILAAVEDSARLAGAQRLILECGDRQPEAIALYTGAGYERIRDFGYYRDHRGVLSFARKL